MSPLRRYSAEMSAQPTTTAPTPVTWPAHDPATYRVVPDSAAPLDRVRVESLLAAEWERFTAQTPGSSKHHARALGSLPLGVPSTFQYWEPYPVAITSAKGAWLTDVDGRRVLDLSMGFGAMLAGHLNPAVVAAVGKALETGTLFVTPSPSATEAAERFQRRFSLDQLRFANSGTEATMYAVRTARAFTQRKAIIKIEGGYHGGYDASCRYRSSPTSRTSARRMLPRPRRRSRWRPGRSTWFRTTTSTAWSSSSPSMLRKSPACSWSRFWRTSASLSLTRATSPECARCATPTAPSWCSTR